MGAESGERWVRKWERQDIPRANSFVRIERVVYLYVSQFVFSAEHRNLTSLFLSNSYSRKHYLMSLKFLLPPHLHQDRTFRFFFSCDKAIILAFQAVDFVKKKKGNLPLSTPCLGRDSSFGVATRWGLEVQVRIPIGARFFARVKTCSGAR